MSKTVAVIGAGIAGLTTAYYLAKKGYKVVVYEQERYAAMKTSFANGGQVSVSNSEVWTTWGNVRKGFKWLFTKDAPLLIRPKLDYKQWKWIAKFLYHTATGAYERNTAWTIRAGIEAQKLYDQLIEEEGICYDRLKAGIVHFYKDEQYWYNAKQVKEIYNNNGCEWNLLTPLQVASLDPALNNITGMIGGTFTPSDSTGDIHKFCQQLSLVLANKYNVEFKYESYVTEKYTMDALTELFDAVVVAAGVGSTELARQVGDTIDVYPVKGYSITINNVDPKYLPKVSLLDDQAKIVTSTLGNRFRVAGTAELTGENYDITRSRIEPLLKWVHTNFPNINTSDYSQWACLRPMTPDMMPITKQSDKNSKVYYNTGHGHLGWTLSPYTSKTVADLI
jgi:D-amino-acid dehydrogenase